MKHLKSYNESIQTVYPVVGKLYKSTIKMEEGKFAGQDFITDSEYIGMSGNNLVFKVVKIYNQEAANYLKSKGVGGVEIGSNSRTGLAAFNRYYTPL